MTKPVLKDNEYVVGVDLGGTNVLGAVVKPGGEVVARAKKRTRDATGPEAVVSLCCEAVNAAIEAAEVPRESVKGVGIGAPGTIDGDNGIVVFAPNLAGFENVHMKEMMDEQLGIPTFLDNDVNVGVLGELKLGVGQGVSNLVGLFVGTGIGGGVVLNGELWRGFNFTAGEVGHIVVRAGGPRCGCGTKGCMEALASRTAIVRRIRNAARKGTRTIVSKLCKGDFSKVASKILVQAVEANDKVTKQSLKKAWNYLGIGIANIVHLLSPEMIILGGGVLEALGDGPVAEVEKVVQKYTLPRTMDNVRIVRAALGDDSGILGAAVLAETELAKESR